MPLHGGNYSREHAVQLVQHWPDRLGGSGAEAGQQQHAEGGATLLIDANSQPQVARRCLAACMFAITMQETTAATSSNLVLLTRCRVPRLPRAQMTMTAWSWIRTTLRRQGWACPKARTAPGSTTETMRSTAAAAGAAPAARCEQQRMHRGATLCVIALHVGGRLF